MHVLQWGMFTPMVQTFLRWHRPAVGTGAVCTHVPEPLHLHSVRPK